VKRRSDRSMSDSGSSDDEVDEVEANNLADPEILTKYKLAGDIANKALQAVLAEVKPGKTPLQLCDIGDKFIDAACAQVYSKAKIEKGIAFPTCISVNHCVAHFSPLSGEDGEPLLPGDVVKVDLGCHLDAYVAQVAHTIVCVEEHEAGAPVIGKAADVIRAAYEASELAHRMLKVGNKNSDVSAMIEKVAESYGVNAVQGVLSHRMKKHVIDGNKVIMNKPTTDHKVEEVEFEVNDVFTMDVVMTTGEGKPNEQDKRTTIYKRAMDTQYNLKMKTSRTFFSEVNKRFTTFPFTLRALSDEKTARMGVVECHNHELMNGYPVLFEKPGDLVAQFKFTALITEKTTHRTTEGPALGEVKSDRSIQDEGLAALLATEIVTKKKKNKKKKTGGGKEGEATEAD